MPRPCYAGLEMSEPEAPKTPERDELGSRPEEPSASKLGSRPEEPSASTKPQDTVGWPDVAAIGIGCLVVVIFFSAIVLVAIMRGE
jgi:hypothetical protein